jgi:hypothetical protein
MEFNFSSISVDTVTAIEKKLDKIKLNVLDEINNFVRILNDEGTLQVTGEMNTVIADLFNDEIKKNAIAYTGVMNKVQNVLRQYLLKGRTYSG